MPAQQPPTNRSTPPAASNLPLGAIACAPIVTRPDPDVTESYHHRPSAAGHRRPAPVRCPSIVVGGLERRPHLGSDGPPLGRQVVLAGPGDGDPVAARSGQQLGTDLVVAQVAAHPAGHAAPLPPAPGAVVAPRHPR